MVAAVLGVFIILAALRKVFRIRLATDQRVERYKGTPKIPALGRFAGKAA